MICMASIKPHSNEIVPSRGRKLFKQQGDNSMTLIREKAIHGARSNGGAHNMALIRCKDWFYALVKTEINIFHIIMKWLSYEFAYANMVLYFMSIYVLM